MQHSESSFQICAVRMLRTAGYFLFSIPNGTKLSASQARIAKSEGLLPGVSDIIILLKNRPIFVEFKNLNGKGKQQQTQKNFEKEVKSRGFDYVIWDDWKKVEKFIKDHRNER